ncbi:MAG: insulinase family protein [Solirubrobacteraceae bacterium]|nr:insulinase family protein [Solirubrobacteraceae bacterium]
MDSVRSVALGFWIDVGSAAEREPEAGLSHLLEHMLFRGTARYESLEIDQLFDGMGAELNAGTGKESTSVYSRIVDVHLPKAFDVMQEMVFAPRILEADLANEREIVCEEIAMYEDDPQDKVFDLLSEAVFGDHPLGRSTIGRAEVIANVQPDALKTFHAAHYGPEDVVIAAAGSVDHDSLILLAEGLSLPARPDPTPITAAPAATPRRAAFFGKETEQYHVCLGGRGLPRHDERRHALRVLDNILGGTSSSRLFQEIREKRGLAYSVYSFTSLFAQAGMVGLYVGTRPDNLEAAMRIAGDELRRFVEDPASTGELERSKENVKGRMVLALESTAARMNRLGGSLLADMPLLTVDEAISRVEAVTMEDVQELARELFDPERLSAAGIGPDEDVFRRSVEHVAPALAAEAAR